MASNESLQPTGAQTIHNERALTITFVRAIPHIGRTARR